MKTLSKILAGGIGLGILAGLAIALLSRCHKPAVPAPAPTTSVTTSQSEVTTTAEATSNAVVAQKVLVRIHRKSKPASTKQDDDVIEVEVTQAATASATSSVIASASSSATASVAPEYNPPATQSSRSDLTDISRWGIGAGLVKGVVFVDYQLVRQTILGQELSLDVQANHEQAGAGLSVTLVGPVFMQAGMSVPYSNAAQPVPYLGAGARLRF